MCIRCQLEHVPEPEDEQGRQSVSADTFDGPTEVYLGEQAHQVGSPEVGPPGSFSPEPGPPGSFSQDDMKLLVDSVEYSIRNARHHIDASWNIHTAASLHPRKSMDDDDLHPCAICIQLAASDKQNAMLMVQIVELNRAMFPTVVERNFAAAGTDPVGTISEAEMRHERLLNGEIIYDGS